MHDSTTVCLKLEAITCTDQRRAKDSLFVLELHSHRLARDWLGKCHSQLVVSSAICAKPVPSSFYDLRAGNNGDVTVMFVVLIHVRKTFAIRL